MSIEKLYSLFEAPENKTGSKAPYKEAPVMNKLIRKQELKELDDDYNAEISKNIELSEELRRNINLYKGNDAAKMLEMTLQCISLMTGDTVFYNQNIKKVNNKNAQGEG